MSPRRSTLALLVLFAQACGDERPNLVLVSLDTLRADRLSYYGRTQRATTPLLDELARESVVFEDCLASSTLTGPSHLSLFTGQFAERHGLRENGPRVEPPYTLASLLAEAGYRTAGFTGGGFLRESFGLAHGFETYRARGGPKALFKRTFATSLPFALEWLAEPRAGPFFLFLHGYDPHCPYEAPPGPLGRLARVDPPPFDPSGRCGEADYVPLLAEGRFGERELLYLEDLYDALVLGADQSLAPFVAKLRESDLLDRSIFVFTSDHGEGLGEHGWIGHGRLWDEQARVPLFIRFPDGRHARRIAEPVASVDLLPTLLDALGVPLPAGVQGESLMPLVRGVPFEPRRPRVVTVGDESTVRFDARFKIAFRAEGQVVDRQVFDLASDPGERDDLHDTAAGRAHFEAIYARYAAWRAEQAPEDARFASATARGELSAEARAELSALGYADE